jgi:hypothetical protein
MKNLLIAVCVLSLASSALSAEKKPQSQLMKADTVKWVGLDYSMVRMVGPEDFRKPETIFPAMLDNWNALFVQERIGRIGGALGKKVVLDTADMSEHNRQATAKQVIPSAGPEDGVEKTHLSDSDIAKAVRSYQLETKEGLALVFIVDRLVKPSQNGAVYVVFFDAKTREVLTCDRHIGRATGGGFRNYWFHVIKETDETLKRYR